MTVSAARQGRVAWIFLLVAADLAATGCASVKELDRSVPVFDTDIRPIFAAACDGCHGGAAPEAGWSSVAFIDVVACVPTGEGATLPADVTAPIVRVLDQPSHMGLVDADQRATIEQWVADGAPARRGRAHDPGMVDPRSPAFHGAQLRAQGWAPMLDATTPGACGQCHAGAPARPDGVTESAPGATACTTCHSDAGGPAACSTCHGQPGVPYPPQDPCFHPDDTRVAGSHAAHVLPSNARGDGLPCSACHADNGLANLGTGTHGDGVAPVVPNMTLWGAAGNYDAATGACTTACHDRGGTMPVVTWGAAVSLDCGSCHVTPPAVHAASGCGNCHLGLNSGGTAFAPGSLHVDGTVQVGDGTGTCGSCHGVPGDPWPLVGPHPSHRRPALRAAGVTCATCHVEPMAVDDAGHLDSTPGAEINFTGDALARGSRPTYDGLRCSNVACHGAGLGGGFNKAPSWGDANAAQCGACHGVPPPPPHVQLTSCQIPACHGDEIVQTVSGPAISDTGRMLHINGALDTGGGL